MEPVVRLSGVSVVRNGTSIIDDLDWEVSLGERWAVIGPNGAGKTTLLSLLSSYVFPSMGRVEVLGSQIGRVDSSELRTRIGMTSAALLDLMPGEERVEDLVISSAYAIFGRWREEYDLWDESRMSALLHALEVRSLRDRTFSTLSEGEKKRVMIARALMPDPELLLMDEPAGGLDLGAREDLLKRIATITSDPAAPAVIMVTHHLEEIPTSTTHILVLKKGKKFAAGEIHETLSAKMLTELYETPLHLGKHEGRFFARSQ